jgi:hypothetical protein
LGEKTSSHPSQRFYGANGAVYLAKLRVTPTLPSVALSSPSAVSSPSPSPLSSSPSNGLPSEFVLKIVYNYDDTLASRDLMETFEKEMQLCQ